MLNISKENNKKAVIYCRVSTKEQADEGNSLNSQEKNCRDYALKNGYNIAEVFIEHGESAKTTQRTQLQKLMNYCASKKNGVSAVIIYKLDRISRNTDDYSQIRILLKRYGVEIKSTSEYFENTPAGRFMENIIANVAQFDNDVRTERSMGGMRDATREGRYVWMAPVGYDNVKIAGKSTIAQNAMAPLVKKAFEMVAENSRPAMEVFRILLSEGFVNRKNKPVSKTYFYNLLNQRLYTGWIYKFGEKHKGTFEPIISEDLFDQVQRVLKYHTRRNLTYLNKHPDFPLRRFIYHPSGKKLTGGWSKGRTLKYPYYRFMIKGCSYKKEYVEDKFGEFVNRYYLNEKHFKIFKQKIRDNLLKEQLGLKKQSEQLTKQIAELKEKQDKLIQKNLDGIITNQILQEQLEYIDKELMRLNVKFAQMPKSWFGILDMADFIKEYLKDPYKIWLSANLQEKISLQWFKFPKGIAFDGLNFRTAEICRLFKVKSEILRSNSIRGSSKLYNTNLKINNSTAKSKKQIEDTNMYWQEVGAEIIRLNEILAKIEGYPQNSKK